VGVPGIACHRVRARYGCCRPDEERLRERLVALARERRRYGNRRQLTFLRFVVNHKRLVRVYCEKRPAVRTRRVRKRALGSRTYMPVPTLPNGAVGAGLRRQTAGERPALPHPGDLRCSLLPGRDRQLLAVGPKGAASSIA
jgi:hypothetical protein